MMILQKLWDAYEKEKATAVSDYHLNLLSDYGADLSTWEVYLEGMDEVGKPDYSRPTLKALRELRKHCILLLNTQGISGYNSNMTPRSYTARARKAVRALPALITDYQSDGGDEIEQDIRDQLHEALGALTALAEVLEIEL